MMNFWNFFFAAVYFVGYYLLINSKYFKFDEIQRMNQVTSPLVENLIQTKYFRIIRLNINQQCPLGLLNKICKSNSCTVCRCNDKDIPQFWTNTDRVKSHTKGQDLWSAQRNIEKQWVWHVEDEQNDQGEYFDIYTNIESFTNYDGKTIWKLVYEENCFHNNYQQMCAEQQILYNLISGLHTSISTHLSRFYKNISSNKIWADLRNQSRHTQFHFNYSQYQRRVLSHPQRIKNLFFIYRILAKAIKQAGPYLLNNLIIQSGNITQDLKSKKIINELYQSLKEYDLNAQQKQSLKFFTPQNPKVKQYQKYIHNISNILNCVECQKCRLFGKMQTYGVGTAIKILLGYPSPYKRNQIVALFNVFNKISMSIDTYYKNRRQIIKIGYEKDEYYWLQIYTYIGSLLLFIMVYLNFKNNQYKSQLQNKQKKK